MVFLPQDVLAPRGDAALAGIRFAVIGSHRAGAYLADLLASQGAQRYKPPGDEQVWVRTELTAQAPAVEVIVDAVGPGESLPRRLGVTSDQIQARGLIFCSFTGLPDAFGDDQPMTDALIHAEVGLNRIESDYPAPEPLPVASTYGAIWAAILIAASLIGRSRDGKGAEIAVSLYGASLSALGYKLLTVHDNSVVDQLRRPRLPMAEIYECADGRHVQNHGLYGHFVKAMCIAMERPEWVPAATQGLVELQSDAEKTQWRQRLAVEFLKRPALEWEERINALGGACAICRTQDEWQSSTHARKSGIVITNSVGATLSGPAVRLDIPGWDSGSVTTAAGSATSSASSDVSRVSIASAAGWPESGATVDDNAPLKGLRVVDLSIVLAGPTCGRTLAELGADVIKIDDPARPVAPYGALWLDVNRGKRSMLLDLKTAAGLRIAQGLIGEADVVIENYRAGKLAELGLSFDQVRARNPLIVYVSMNALDRGGPWSGRGGWEQIAQAVTGMQCSRGVPPKAVPFTVNDYSTGLVGAYGVLLGLFARAGHGAIRVTGSLARTASWLQRDANADANADADADDDRAGGTVIRRTADGWVRVAEPNDGAVRSISRLPVADIESMMTGQAVHALRELGFCCVADRTPTERLLDGSLGQAGLVCSWIHPRLGAMRQQFSGMQTSRFAASPRWPAPEPGADTVRVLTGLGFDQTSIDDLLSARIAYAVQRLS